MKLFICLLCFIRIVELKNILVISLVVSPSHSLWHRILSNELVQRGHNVTFLAPDYYPSFANFTMVHLDGVYEKLSESKHDLEKLPTESAFSTTLFEWMVAQCPHQLNSNGYRKLYNNSDTKFDLIIIDVTTSIECVFPLIHKLQTPLIGSSPFGLPPWFNDYTGDWLYPSSVPHYALPYSNSMTFPQRFHNFFVILHSLLQRRITEIRILKQSVNSDLNLKKNFSLFLLNMDFLMGFPRPIVPNVIPVGGLHVKLQNNIPEYVMKWLDENSNVILFSLGSNVRTNKLSSAKLKIILDAFREMSSYSFIIKWETEVLPDKPDNVFTQKWLPQYDVLCHPNVKALFGHGGELSLQEAIYAGKPVLGMPFFLDQKNNMNRIVQRGLGLRLDYTNLTVEEIKSSLKKLVDDTNFKSRMEKLSLKVRDQPQTPMERAMFWIEYVLRHGHLTEFQCSSLHQPFWETYCLDILATVLVFIYILAKLFLFIVRKFIYSPHLKTNKFKIN